MTGSAIDAEAIARYVWGAPRNAQRDLQSLLTHGWDPGSPIALARLATDLDLPEPIPGSVLLAVGACADAAYRGKRLAHGGGREAGAMLAKAQGRRLQGLWDPMRTPEDKRMDVRRVLAVLGAEMPLGLVAALLAPSSGPATEISNLMRGHAAAGGR